MKIPVQIIMVAMLLLTSKVATAAMVDGGFLTATMGGSSGSYNIFGNGFAGHGGIQQGGWWLFINCGTGCPGGTVSSINGTVTGGDVDGGHYFHFTGPSVILTQGLVFADFSFDGSFCQGGYPNYCPLGLLPLTGSGQVRIEVVVDSTPPSPYTIRVKSFTYTFNQTPEPSFAPMIALGLLALAAAKRYAKFPK